MYAYNNVPIITLLALIVIKRSFQSDIIVANRWPFDKFNHLRGWSSKRQELIIVVLGWKPESSFNGVHYKEKYSHIFLWNQNQYDSNNSSYKIKTLSGVYFNCAPELTWHKKNTKESFTPDIPEANGVSEQIFLARTLYSHIPFKSYRKIECS